MWIKLEPITVAELLELLTVPVSLYISWKIFESGKKQEMEKSKVGFLVEQCGKLKAHIENLEKDIISYYSNPHKNSQDKQALEININSKMSSLQRKLPKLGARAGYGEHYFFNKFLAFKENCTGFSSGFGSDNLKPKAPTDEMFLRVGQTKENLLSEIETIIDAKLAL